MEIGFPELLIALVVVLLIYGPGRLTGLGRDLGQAIRNFRRGLSGPSPDDEDLE
ncbi:MAG: twin-arginine translocase TatA/TatE family subunit [Chloroflexi bacterium]|nr:twin-arginine translocase TatA/TatE family subunit [Chloroflexota bacterium]